MSTYIRYAKATKLMINNVVYIISPSFLNLFKLFVKRVESRTFVRAIPSASKSARSEPVNAFEKQPEAADAAQQANSETNCKQIHFLSFLKQLYINHFTLSK